MTRDEVVSILGPPTQARLMHPVSPTVEILWYSDWLELAFRDDVLNHLSLRYKWQRPWKRRLKLPRDFHARWAATIRLWSYARFRTLLHARNVSFKLQAWDDGSLTMDVLSGAIVFDDAGGIGLHSINHTAGGNTWNLPQAVLHRPPALLRLNRTHRQQQ